MSDKRDQEKELAIRLLENVNAHLNKRIAELEKALEDILQDASEVHNETSDSIRYIATNALKGGGN